MSRLGVYKAALYVRFDVLNAIVMGLQKDLFGFDKSQMVITRNYVKAFSEIVGLV